VIFTSDWHLPAEGPSAHLDLFVRFLDEVGRRAAHLVVLGDLFYVWVGAKHARCPGYAAALEALGRLAASGTPVTVIHGNRDFLLSRKPLERHSLAFGPRIWRFELGGMRVMATHGDQFAEDDRLQKFSQGLLSRFPLRQIMGVMPLATGRLLARAYRYVNNRRRESTAHNPPPLNRDRIRAELASGTDTVIVGHWHKGHVETDAFGLPGKTLLMLGQGTEREASYAELSGGIIQLKTFVPAP